MTHRISAISAMLVFLTTPWGCDFGEFPKADPQFVKLQFRYDFGNVVDTFNGTLTKNLAIDGTITVPFG